MPVTFFVPRTITVHLGAADDPSAENVTVPFIDYIKNVASSEIYPTWPESAIRANIYAQITFALNRIFTQFYRGQCRQIGKGLFSNRFHLVPHDQRSQRNISERTRRIPRIRLSILHFAINSIEF